MATGTGNIASASIGVVFEYSKTKENAKSSVPVVTDIRGGNSVSIDAKSGDINSHGAQIIAGYDEYGLISDGAGDISLKAGNDINLESAHATHNSSSSNKSASASIGYSVGIGLGETKGGWTGSVNVGSGKSNSSGTTQVKSHVTGAGDIKLESGRDTNLKGAVVEGKTIIANVGRDLNIISVPDTAESSNKSSSIGVSGSLGAGGAAITGVSPGYGTGSGKTNWIEEQSGLVAKDKVDVTVGGNTHLGAGKIVSESGDLKLDTSTLTYQDFSGSKKYEGFDIQANIDLTGKKQQPDQTEQPKHTAEGSYKKDDTQQEVRATVGPGEISIRDKDKQAELEASGQTEDIASLNRDPDQAYEITKDKHVEIDYYLSDTSVKAALEAGKTTVEIVIDALGRMANDGKLTPQDYDTARRLAKYKDDPNVIAQLNACGQRQGFNQFNPFDWLITPAHAQAPCMISTAEGTFPISVFGAATCRASFAVMTSTAGLVGAAAGSIILVFTNSAGGVIDETHKLGDGTVVRLQGGGSALKRTATLSMPDGTSSVLDFMLDPVTGALVLTGGTLDGKPMGTCIAAECYLQHAIWWHKNVVLSEKAPGIGHNGGPPLDDKGSNNGGKPPLVPPPVLGMNIDYDKISTAKPWQSTAPRNLEEQVLWQQVLNNPASGEALNLNNDKRFPPAKGWQKTQTSHQRPDGTNITIHYW